jgi:hypothetical protein
LILLNSIQNLCCRFASPKTIVLFGCLILRVSDAPRPAHPSE